MIVVGEAARSRLTKVAAAAILMMVTGCSPGYVHPAAAPLVGVRSVGNGTVVTLLRPCAGQDVIALHVESDDGERRWEIEPDVGAPQPTELPLLETPEGWHVEDSTLTSIGPGEVYVAGFSGFGRPDVQPVKFRTSDLAGLSESEVWTYEDEAGELMARAMSIEEFEERARNECEAHENRAGALPGIEHEVRFPRFAGDFVVWMGPA